MSSLKQRIAEDLKRAMKARDAASLSALRLLKSAITNREIELGSEVDDLEILRLVEKQLKQRRESAEVYRQAGRSELAEKEEKEASVLQSYLPARLAPDELERLVDEVIAELGASSMKDMGPVMKAALAKAQGRAASKAISDVVKSKLASR
ncbi:MAG: GatB/YqeY domain-containing protein [Myxococcales bacterium]|jgi:uncharacterized protein YqeY